MTNLLKETISAIEYSGHEINDVVFIGSDDGKYSCTWEEFEVMANHNYDCGYGAAKVVQDLVVVFDDNTYLFRGEYDGSEWWEYKEPIEIQEETRPIKTLFSDFGWEDISTANSDEED